MIAGGGLPVTGQVRLVAVGFAPTFFTTVNVDGNQMRELVEHLPPGTTINGEPLLDGGALQIATLLNVELPAEEAGAAARARSRSSASCSPSCSAGWWPAPRWSRSTRSPTRSRTWPRRPTCPAGSRRARPDELGRLRRTFNRLLEALESSRRSQSQLVLDASHELRTPLTSLRTNLEVIRRVDELSAEDRSVLVDDVLVQLQELTDIVGDLAELARGDRGRRRGSRCGSTCSCRTRWPSRTRTGAPRTCTSSSTPRRAGSWPATTACAGPWATCSTTPASGARRAKRSRWSAATGTVVVRDHGPGIAEDDLPHIFDRFYRSPAARGLPGSGLGLAIVAQVVKAEGGTIVAENDPRGGARMSMRLPTVPGPAMPTAGSEPARPDAAVGTRAGRGLRRLRVFLRPRP